MYESTLGNLLCHSCKSYPQAVPANMRYITHHLLNRPEREYLGSFGLGRGSTVCWCCWLTSSNIVLNLTRALLSKDPNSSATDGYASNASSGESEDIELERIVTPSRAFAAPPRAHSPSPSPPHHFAPASSCPPTKLLPPPKAHCRPVQCQHSPLPL